MQELEQLREQLSLLDIALLEQVARRQQLVAEIGRVKSGAGRGTRDFTREKAVLNLARETAQRVGVDGDVAEELFRLLIRASLAAQEQEKVTRSAAGDGKRVLVVGGAGQMGRWFVRFLSSQGYAVELCDPAADVAGYSNCRVLDESDLAHDLILIAAPIAETVTLLEQLARRQPRGVIVDISSLKGPLQPGYDALKQAGCRVASMHPLFGPDTDLLSGRNLIFVDLGVADALAVTQELFDSTMVDRVVMSLESHDRAMAYVLGLSHAVNIAFFNALGQSGEDAMGLAKLSSTTFDAQLDVASHVARENPYLYYEVQALNANTPRAMVSLLNAVSQVAGRVLDGDEQGFVELMERGKSFLSGRPQHRP